MGTKLQGPLAFFMKVRKMREAQKLRQVKMEGWVKLHRKITEWELFGNARALQVFIWLMTHATRIPYTTSDGIRLESGQVAITTRALADRLGIPRRSLRDTLRVLEETETVKISTAQVTAHDYAHQKSVVTICKWADYQTEQQYPTAQVTAQVTAQPHITRNNNKKYLFGDFSPNQTNKIDWNIFARNWNGIFAGTNTSAVKVMTAKRRRLVQAIYDRYGWAQISQAMQKAADSRELNRRGMDFCWFFTEDNFVNVLEGRYDNKN